MSQEALDALDAWHTTTRALRNAKPGSGEWVRLRMIAEQQHAEYEALITRTEDPTHSAEAAPQEEVRAR
jgi:hypothetical protein